MSENQFTNCFNRLKRRLGDKISPNVPLASYLSWRTGGPVRILALAETLSDLRMILEQARESDIPYFVLGRGSNLLLSDDGFGGIVIKLAGSFRKIFVDGSDLHAGGAASLSALLHASVRNSLGDLTFTAGIPGSLGGALTMNAGAFGKSIGDLAKEVVVYDTDGQLQAFHKEKLSFSYRQSSLVAQGVIVEATLCLRKNDPARIKGELVRFFRKRKETQPLGSLSAGSVFKNPPGLFAGKLIEEAGCKGLRIGHAQVSAKHANFITNMGRASADSIYHLIVKVQDEVYKNSGVFLEPEVTILGQFDEPLVRRTSEGQVAGF